MPEEQSFPVARKILIGIALFGMLAILVGAYVYVYTDIFKARTSTATSDTTSREITAATRSGDFETAMRNSDIVLHNPQSSADEKARAFFSSIGSRYRASGDTQARLEEIRAMKRFFLDENVSLSIRVDMLNAIAQQYASSGSNSVVFDEIFSDEPFRRYLDTSTKGNERERLSLRKLMEWSYELMPSSYSAINIARWYSEQGVFNLNPDLSAETIARYNQLADEYVLKANAATILEGQRDATFLDSSRYLTYRYWLAVITGRLANAKGSLGDKYKTLYKQRYDEFIQFTQTQNNIVAAEYRLYARMFYAQVLVREGNTPAAKVQLDLLAQEIGGVQNVGTNAFIAFIRNEYNQRPTGGTWRNLVRAGFDISPAFKVAVENIVGVKL